MRGSSVARRALALAVVLVSLFGLVGSATAVEPASALPDDRPNIVMFYIDDVPPHDGSLWSDPLRTPNVVDRFIDRGIHFDHAIGEVPLCCPGRGSTLTGLHAHNNGVIHNDAQEFDPSEHIGKAMKDAGYASFFIGKYLNMPEKLTRAQWLEHDAGWTQLDVLRTRNGGFFDYPLHTKQGTSYVNNLHSTQMVGDRMVMHLQETPADQPLFALLSIFDMHAPNLPQEQDVGDPRCANMPPFNRPNYNEADVSDKPGPIKALPLLPFADGWPMVTYCEEMLGVDRVIGQVVDELEAAGRLDNTLLVFTADNGMAWGAHRQGQNKVWPYATPVPLYMSWPAAGWGTSSSTNSEIVSNIDLAPTFCDLAQTCQLGPFAHHIDGPDGLSLVPLITGDVANLGRDAVLEASYINEEWAWAGLRTTSVFDGDDRWHYVEYINGFRELYDLLADPFELTNIASNPERAELIETLHTRLGQLRLEGVKAGQGSITIIQDVRPQSAFDYAFSGDLGTFDLDDDSDPTLSNQKTFNNLASGYYTISRPTAHDPWVAADVLCDGVLTRDPVTGSVTMLVHPDEAVVCTWIDAKRRPDAMIAGAAPSKFKGNDIYKAVPNKTQSVRRDDVAIGSVTAYRLRLQNDGLAEDSFLFSTTTTGPSTMSVRFTFNGTDVTEEMLAGTFQIDLVWQAAQRTIAMTVTAGPGTPVNSVFTVLTTVRSVSDPTRLDVVRTITTT